MIATADLLAYVKASDAEAALVRSLERAAVDLISRSYYVGPVATITEQISYRGGVVRLKNEPRGAVTLDEWNGTAWVAVTDFRVSGRLLYLQGSRRHVAMVPLRATYSAGYDVDVGDPDVWAAPEPIKQAVRMIVEHWYINREAVVVGTSDQLVQLGVKTILEAYQ